MERLPEEERIARVMADRTGTDPSDWYLVLKARHGMLLAFESVRRALGEGAVVTQLLTCCTAVDPIVAAGMEPRYGELSARNASLDPDALPLSDDVRAVVVQHTYGIVDDASSAALAARAHEAGALVVEDCAHCATRMARDAAGAPVADVSVHSFGMGKMLGTLLGGAVWVNPASAHRGAIDDLRARLEALPVSGRRIDLLEGAFIPQNRVFNHVPASVARGLRHGLARVGLFEPPVSVDELRGKVSREPMRPSAHLCSKVLAAFDRLRDTERMRAEAAEVLRRELAGTCVETFAAAMEGPVQPLLRFPVLAPDTAAADRLIREVCAAGYYTTAWYRPELFPGVLDPGAYRVPSDRSGLSTSDDITARVAPLPTDHTPTELAEIARIARAVCSGER